MGSHGSVTSRATSKNASADGRIDGFALDDWLQAQIEILGAQRQQKVKAAKGSK
jgi:Protein of unknown function (DUF2934)